MNAADDRRAFRIEQRIFHWIGTSVNVVSSVDLTIDDDSLSLSREREIIYPSEEEREYLRDVFQAEQVSLVSSWRHFQRKAQLSEGC